MNSIDIDSLVNEYIHDSAEWKYYEKKALKQLCCILAYQKDGQRYKYVDGFDSLEQYADKVLNIKKSLCYKYANVGEKFFYSSNTRIREIAEQISTANLIEILPIKDEHVIILFDEGIISQDSTQTELRDLAKTYKDLSLD